MKSVLMGRRGLVTVLLMIAIGLSVAAGGTLALARVFANDGGPKAQIVMRAYRCEQGVGTRQELLGKCSLLDGVFFMSNGVDGYSGASGRGMLAWPSVVPGNTLLAEDVPVWSTLPRVFCGVSPTAGVPPQVYDEVALSHSTTFAKFFRTRQLSEHLYCDWFNIAA